VAFTTVSDLPIERLCTGADLDPSWSESEKLGFPGEFPYTRGIHPTMYRGRFWTMRQYAGFGTAEESNARYRYLLAQGQTGLSIAFDLPTQLGYDSDHDLARGEVGKVGVAIDSLRDMEVLLQDLPLDRVSTSMTINATAAILLALYVAVAKRRGVDPSALSGTVQNDILKEYAARGNYIYPAGASMRLAADLIVHCSDAMPRWNPISISGYHIREAGATAVQEVAFTLANGIAYVEELRRRGVALDVFVPRLSFFFNAQSNLFEEVAKFRAARRLWAKIVKGRFGARDRNLGKLRFHTQTAGVSLTAQQPENNVVRVTLQALSAVLGGTQSLHTNAMDEALGLPTEKAALTALRTQQVIAYESGAADTIDPLAGSYYVENLTDRIEEAALAYIGKIDALGGAVAAIESGYVQKEIHESAYRFQRKVESGDETIVGLNRFREDEAGQAPPPILRVGADLEAKQIERLESLRRERDAAAVAGALAAVEAAARGGDNLFPPILAAVEALATVGEISGRLRSVFGEYRESFAI
jgi:methylmalonyl-CoA mutase N-terminal domain/subunit